MNACVPLWNMENDYRSSHDLLPAENQSKSMREENELLELVWQNGHVLMQSQTRETTCEHKENSKHGTVLLKNGSLLGNPNNLDQEDETASWMQYHYDDSLAKDFFSDFHGMPTSESIGTDELGKDNIPEERYVKFGFNEETNTFTTPPSKQTSGIHNEETTMPPHNSKIIGGTIPQTGNAEKSEFVSFSHFTRMVKTDAGTCRHSDQKDTRNVSQKGVGKSSSMLSSNWQHNQIHEQPDIGHKLGSAITEALPMQERDVQRKFHERDRSETNDTVTVTSSGGSGSSIGRQGQQITSSQNHKRKGRDVEQSGCHSEEAENQSMEVGRRPQKSKSTHRSRAAEVHNLSERRRRDRINEKMKALQELIPHCNKTDKASMLDEAIEYLKSLQLQVQIMWMGSGMAPMMFLNPHQYMSFMGWGMGQGSIPSIPGSSQTSSIPMPNQSVPPVGITYQEANIPSQALNPVNFSNQMQSSNIPDAHAHYLGFRNMQSPSQAMDLFSSIHSLSIQPNQTTTADSNNPSSRLNPSDNNQNGKSDFLGVA